jgi:hypothetical protein
MSKLTSVATHYIWWGFLGLWVMILITTQSVIYFGATKNLVTGIFYSWTMVPLVWSGIIYVILRREILSNVEDERHDIFTINSQNCGVNLEMQYQQPGQVQCNIDFDPVLPIPVSTKSIHN